MHEGKPKNSGEGPDECADNHLTDCVVEQIDAPVTHESCHHNTSDDYHSAHNFFERRVMMKSAMITKQQLDINVDLEQSSATRRNQLVTFEELTF